jgi:NAD(P)H-hydrate epimerase
MLALGSREARLIDEAAMEQLGLPCAVLMENAAHAVVEAAIEMSSDLPTPVVFLVLCGKGNNGGDGFAAARLLRTAGHDVRLCETDPGADLGIESAMNREAARRLGIPSVPSDAPGLLDTAGSLVVLDAVFGTGFHGTLLPKPIHALFDRIRDAKSMHPLRCRVLAVDLVSGTDCDTGRTVSGALAADATLCFVLPKMGTVAMPGLLHAGRILVRPIGFPTEFALSVLDKEGDRAAPTVEWMDDALAARHAPRRNRDSHKGEFGRVVVCGGSPGMPGAACLAAEAAGRSGVGRVWGAVPEAILSTCVATLPETMWRGLHTEDPAVAVASFASLLEGKETCAIGPGLGTGPLAFALVEAALASSASVVLDADALRCLAAAPSRMLSLLSARVERGLTPAVLTPHGAEFEALAVAAGLSVANLPPLSAARALAARLDCIVIRKGHGSLVSDPQGRVFLNTTGGDGLAKGGSGDLLCGLVAGFVAQGLPALEAAACAVHLHGLAGDLAETRLGARSMLPRDLLDDLPEAYRRCGWDRAGV